jgi:hypothetical protein
MYWPISVFVCGFWYAPKDWEVSETGDIMSKCAQVEPRMEPSLSRCLEQHPQSSSPPIFVGLSSIGWFVPNSFFLQVHFFACSMGFMKNPEGMLKVLKAVLEATNNRAVGLSPHLNIRSHNICCPK